MISDESNLFKKINVDKEWENLTVLLKSLIRTYPNYSNPDGIKKCINLIWEYLSNGVGYEYKWLKYRNEEIEFLPNYVEVDSFGIDFLDDRIKEKVSIIAQNKIARKKVSHTIVLNGHYDVDSVFDFDLWFNEKNFCSAEEVNNKLYGRGATDMLAGLCCLISAFKTFCANVSSNLRVILTIVPDEEIGGNGSVYILEHLKKNYDIDIDNTTVLIAEPTNQKVCLESLGFFPFQIDWEEPTCHAGHIYKPNNIMNDVSEIIDKLDDFIEEALSSSNHVVDKTIFRSTIGKLHGGEDPAVPIGNMRLEGAIFLSKNVDTKTFRDALNTCISKKISCSFKLLWSHLTFEGHLSDKVELAQRLANYSEEFEVFPSPCDARIFADEGLSVVIYGPGSIQQAHATNEFVCLKQVDDYFKNLCKILCEYF